jgi:hypothetical protein
MVVEFNIDNFPDNSKPLWRYITFSKFVSLLISRHLHFTRADKFLDTFESSIPHQDLQNARNYFAALLSQPVVDVDGVSKFEKSGIRGYIQHFLKLAQKDAMAITDEELPKYMLRIANRFQYVNCWQMNESESAGMWQLYMNANEGVAIQTTIEALKQSVQQSKYSIYLGAVSYIDYTNESWGAYQALSPIFHKRKSFAHEREVRAVIVNPTDVDARNTDGVLIPVQLQTLVKNVFISPKAGNWFKETVKSVSIQYGLNIEPIQSTLYDEPQF